MKINCNNYLAKPNQTLEEHSDKIRINAKILLELGYISLKTFYLLIKVGDNHDLGKCNEYFSKRVRHIITKFDKSVEVPHNILSIFLMDRNDFESDEEFYLVAYAVLGHHNYVKNYSYLGEKENKEKINNLLSPFGCSYKNIGRKGIECIKINQNNKEAILLTGLLQKCDWAASASIENPDSVVEIKNDYLLNVLNNWKDSLNIEFRPLQLYALENTNENCITIAQTGMGKTEAALLWIGNNKGFFFLPLKVSNNAIYERCKNLITDGNFSNKVGLLHSDMSSYYNNDNEDTNIVKHADVTRSLSLPLTISTVDQLFDFVYKYAGYERKIATLSYSKVVIDEIQSYDPKIMAAIIFGIREIISFGGKVHILTATLPPYIRDLLMATDKNDKKIDFKYKKFIDDSVKRHNVKVEDKELTAADILKGYNRHKGKTLAIFNTKKKAQKIYKALVSAGVKNVHLLHSGFSVEDRRVKESQILECGKTEHEEDIIWITTQIVEASLDIDFDYLYTEMTDLASLFQRMGRDDRKGLKPCDDYNCFVYLKIDKKLIGLIIDESIYELSCEAMRTVDGLLLESEKDRLIEEYLTTKKLKEKNCKFLQNYKLAYNELSSIYPEEYEKANAKLRDIVNFTFIPKVLYENNLDEINKCLEIINSHCSYEERLKAKDRIKDFTVSVPGYEKNKLGKKTEYSVPLSKYEFVEIYDCEYSFEEGIVYNI